MENTIREQRAAGPRRVRRYLPWGATLALISIPLAGCGIHPVYLNRPAPSEALALRGSRTPDPNPLTQILRRFVDLDGRVDYRGLAKDHALLDEWLQAVAPVRASSFTSEQQKAFWINAHNALMLRAVVLYYPMSSPRDLRGLYRRCLLHVGEEVLSVDEIVERKLLVLGDLRVLFALHYACLGGPPLQREPWRGADCEDRLRRLSRSFLSDKRFNLLLPEENRVVLSPLFLRYLDAFEACEGGLRGFLSDQLPGKATLLTSPATRIEFGEWDWALDVRK